MEELTEEQAREILDRSLVDLQPRAVEMTFREFCSDCPKKTEDCFPCKTAQTMIRLMLSLVVREQAKFN